MLTIRLSESTEQRLNKLAKETHRPKSFYVREAIERSLNEMEDIYLAQIRIESLRAGQSKTYTLEEVEKELDLEDNI
jgi:RHH-type transcriptional regulator, rel operon repressor / antitoxin RelB